MELVGVSHGLTLQELFRWESLAKSLGANPWQVYDTGTPAFDAKINEVTVVSNSHYEFGGYLAGVHRVKTEGPYVILNSTVFQSHSLALWGGILRSPKAILAPIYGDATPSPDTHIAEIPHPYYSSWIFLIRDRQALKAFTDALEHTLCQVSSEPSQAYAAYLDRWLHPRNRFYGWHGPKTLQAIQRKKQTVRWEHLLSAELATLGIESFQARSPWHPMAQIADKFKRHWASFAKF